MARGPQDVSHTLLAELAFAHIRPNVDGWMSYHELAKWVYNTDCPTRYQREHIAHAAKRLPEVETKNMYTPNRVGYARLTPNRRPTTITEWYRGFPDSNLHLMTYCPACGYNETLHSGEGNKIIRRGHKSVRMECGKCAMRWTMNIDDFLDRQRYKDNTQP